MDKPYTLAISVRYMDAEKSKGLPVQRWVKEYCLRNKIPFDTKLVNSTIYPDNEIPYLELKFKSYNQQCWFLRKAQRRFPYFEFQ